MTEDRMKSPADHPSPEELTGYLDRELDQNVLIRVRGHVESCPDCAAHLSDLSRMDDLGAALNDDLPGPEYWPGLRERILKRVEEEGGASEAAVAAGGRSAIAESPPKRTGRRGLFGWRPLGWTVATAAALGFVILTSRGILHQSTPAEPEIASRSAERNRQAAEPQVEDSSREPALSSGAMERDKADRDEFAVGSTGRRLEVEKKETGAPRTQAEVERPAERSDRPAPTGGKIVPGEEGFAKDVASPVPALAPPAPAAADEDGADQGPPAAKSIGRASADRQLSSSMEVSGTEDFGIVYAAAFRALEAGEFETAARGFDIVSRQDPESDLAREADVQGRMARIRIRIAGGEDRREILKEAADRAEASFRRAGGNPGRAACREALADERVRIRLLEEIEPAANREVFEKRVRSLSDCS